MESEPDSEELTDWERIQSPSNSAVVVKEGFVGGSSVFLPKNHEDLVIKAPEDNNQEGPEVTDLQSSSPGDDGRWRLKKLHFLCGWVPCIALGIRNNAVFRVGFWSFALTAGGVAALALVSLLRRRMLRWRKNLQLNRGKESLLALIKDQEKRINQLLLQIAQMNEDLRARRRVRVLRANDL